MAKQEIATEGVNVPREIVEQSKSTKKRHKSARQTEVYRDISNLKYIIVKLMLNAPRRCAKYFDEMLVTVSNAKQSLALALEDGDEESRRSNLSYAKVMIEDLQDDAVILNQLNVITKADKKVIRKLAQRVAGQNVRLRDYFKSQGMDVNGKTL